MPDQTPYTEMTFVRPTPSVVKTELAELERTIERGEVLDALRVWDRMRRELGTYASLANIAFVRDTADVSAKAERDFVDEFMPRLTDAHVRLKRAMIERREELEPQIGAHVFELWKCDVAAFEPSIEEDLVAEAKISSKYTEMLASAAIEFRGETHNLSSIRKFSSSADREERHGAEKASYDWVASHADELDGIYDKLVHLRHQQARKLGFDNYVPLGYLMRHRIDYDAGAVARFRDEVRRCVVPLACEIVEDQAARLGIDKVMKWDEAVTSKSGGPKLICSGDDLLDAAQSMFDDLHGEIGTFFRMMNERGLMDLESRANKAPGGFCTSLETYEVPFVYANFNGTRGDVEVFTHEMGHAFQCWKSMQKFPLDLVWPTLESCEIHSMSLEYLCWPYMERFFGDDADQFRRTHLGGSMTFLPYGCAVDHFQHMVYENPDATADDRYAMWREVRSMYTPWRDWGDIEHGARGGRWQVQAHIFQAPFYYIDYVLAETCALQFWDRAERDRGEAIDAYVELCSRGGEAPFQELARSAGLRSPFEDGCLESAVGRARDFLNL